MFYNTLNIQNQIEFVQRLLVDSFYFSGIRLVPYRIWGTGMPKHLTLVCLSES